MLHLSRNKHHYKTVFPKDARLMGKNKKSYLQCENENKSKSKLIAQFSEDEEDFRWRKMIMELFKLLPTI